MESGEEEEGFRPENFSDEETQDVVTDLNEQLNALHTCYALLRKHGAEFQRALTDFESNVNRSDSKTLRLSELVSEKGALLGISAKALLLSSDSYKNSASSDAKKLMKSLHYEKSRAKELERMVKSVAKEQFALERKTQTFSQFATNIDDHATEETRTDEEEDRNAAKALEESDSLTLIRKSVAAHKLHRLKKSPFKKMMNKNKHKESSPKDEVIIDAKSSEVSYFKVPEVEIPSGVTRVRRSRVPTRPNIPFSAWGVLKNSIGKDLSKIPMPVNFNEPISVLQRITEAFENSSLLDAAAKTDDVCEQLMLLAAFSISIFAPTALRSTKPFNPLLGETYELDRTDDMGWRSITEQVSHHPPISALHCEGRGWTYWQEFGMVTKFRGKNINVHPTGFCCCKFHNTGCTFKWGRPSTIVHNIFVGKMWFEQQGLVSMVSVEGPCQASCSLNYSSYSYFSNDTPNQVNGAVKDQDDVEQWHIKARWDEKVEAARAGSGSALTNEFKIIWQKTPLDPESENYHYFSRFACQLNEIEPNIAPTDSRLRPDVRLMEDGYWDESNAEKLRLEQKQRQRRKDDAATEISTPSLLEQSQPIWFERKIVDDNIVYSYRGTYWDAKQKQDWSKCPDIY